MATVERLEDLVVWKLSVALKREVIAIIAKPSVRRDVGFCDQIRDSSRSAPRNIAEGFGRYRPREFSRFLSIAIGSLRETQSLLHDALDEHYIDDDDFNRLMTLASRAIAAAVRLVNYLDTCPERKPPSRKSRARAQPEPEPEPEPKT